MPALRAYQALSELPKRPVWQESGAYIRDRAASIAESSPNSRPESTAIPLSANHGSRTLHAAFWHTQIDDPPVVVSRTVER